MFGYRVTIDLYSIYDCMHNCALLLGSSGVNSAEEGGMYSPCFHMGGVTCVLLLTEPGTRQQHTPAAVTDHSVYVF